MKGPQAASDILDRAWCDGIEDTIPVQSHLCLTAEQVPSPRLTLSLICCRREAPIGAVWIQGHRLAHTNRTGAGHIYGALDYSVSDSLGAFP